MWPDGRVHDGQWRQGQRCGRALYVNSKGEERFGVWIADKLDHWCDTEPPPTLVECQPRENGMNMTKRYTEWT
eukprot:11024-Amphidinium_carterae.1